MNSQLQRNHIILVVGLVGFFALALGLNASAGKVQVCHYTESELNPTVEIVISENALQNHLDHGDSIFDPVEGCTDGGGGPSPV